MGYSAASQAIETNCASVFMASLDTFILANGWSDVETWTSGAEVANIYKSAVADNGVADMYLCVSRVNDTATTIYFSLSEDYDAVNHKLRKYVPSTGAGITVSSSDNTVTDATGQLPNSSTLLRLTLTISASAFNYWMSCNHHRFIISTRIGTNEYGVYAGQAENTLNETTYPYSAVCMFLGKHGYASSSKTNNATPNTAAGGFTREPGAPAAANGNFSGYSLYGDTGAVPKFDGLASFDSIYQSGNIITRAGIYSSRDPASLFVPRAMFPSDVLFIPRVSGTAVNGDTFSYNSKTYVKMGGTVSAPYFVDNSV